MLKECFKIHTVAQRILGPKHENAFEKLQDTVQNAVRISHPKQNHLICIFMDSLVNFWAVVLTQTIKDECHKNTEKQQDEPSGFIGGKLVGPRKHWTTYEKEAYKIVKVFNRMDFLLWGLLPV